MTAESVDSDSGNPSATRTSETDEVLIGSTLLGSYVVERALGEGGMGRIYQAQHTRIADKRFAVKVLRPELITSAQVRGRFQREIEAIARVTHPSVLSIIDVGTTDRGWPFMVCEYLGGLDLMRYLRRFGALPDERVVQLGCRIAEALEATHAQGVIHRDLKPSNVFLLGAFEPLGPEWDRVKLIDFGLSRFVSRDDQLSKSGVVMGTPSYMSPEQARGTRTDHLTDVYGVGAVLYTAATGVPPFREETPQQTLIAVLSREPARPRAINPAISEQLELVIQRALAKQPEQRYPSMSALRLALSELEQRSGARNRARQTGQSGMSVRWRFMALATSALLLGVAALSSAVLGLLALRDADLWFLPGDPLPIALGAGAAFGLCMLALSSFWRRTWRDTAKVADWLPRLRAPLLTTLALYGLGSLGVRLGDDVLARVPMSDALGRAPRLAWPGWTIALAVLALAGGLSVALHDGWWRPLRPRQRWAYGIGLSSALALLAFTLLRFDLLPDDIGPLSFRTRTEASEPATHEVSASSLHALSASAQLFATAPEPTALVLDGGTNGDAALGAPDAEPNAEQLEATREPARTPEARAVANPEPVKAVPVTIEVAAHAARPSPAPTTPPVIEPPTLPSNRDLPAPSGTLHELTTAEALEATAVRQATDPRTLASAVDNIERLLALSPGHAGDPDVQRILRQAANSSGEASHAAFRVMSELMGSRGPDMIYDLMMERPALTQQAKFRLTRFRVRRLFSPQLSIAYDLRFFETCAGRISLLPRANETGDQRSLNVLASLATPPASCGRNSARCMPTCPREAAAFSRSMEIITQRLRAAERAASAN